MVLLQDPQHQRCQSPGFSLPTNRIECKAALQTGSNGAVGDVQPVARAGEGECVIGPRHGSQSYLRQGLDGSPAATERERAACESSQTCNISLNLGIRASIAFSCLSSRVPRHLHTAHPSTLHIYAGRASWPATVVRCAQSQQPWKGKCSQPACCATAGGRHMSGRG